VVQVQEQVQERALGVVQVYSNGQCAWVVTVGFLVPELTISRGRA
jgi:hypothetical protein